MKVRVGFVSNSSSQSFVMLGVDVSKIGEEELKKALAAKLNFQLPEWADDLEEVSLYDIVDDSDIYDEADEGRYFGIRLASVDDSYMDTFAFSLEKLKEYEVQLRELFASIGYPDAEIKLVGGTETC